ncbi:MAG TPA: hypothetical protein VFX96_04315 [Pyrinomonadaceae bacterium]|nr:hypothetical protein [Pyrinomonadaceae bacterium]
MKEHTSTHTPTRADAAGRARARDFEGRAALVIAHPGHELCVHGWLGRARPEVFVLTDGSGRQGVPRLASTMRNLSEAGARPGPLFGRYRDRDIYQALLSTDVDFFTSLALELAEGLARGRFAYVVGDAIEGYNPTHDICRAVTNAAVEIANRRASAPPIQNFDFPIIDPPEGEDARGHIRLRLDEAAYRRKIEVMRSCPELSDEVSAGLDGASLKVLEMFGDLSEEVGELVKRRGGGDSFRVETLRPAVETSACEQFFERPPFYERYGEKLVAYGFYRHVIRYREHFAPVAESLRAFASHASLTEVVTDAEADPQSEWRAEGRERRAPDLVACLEQIFGGGEQLECAGESS